MSDIKKSNKNLKEQKTITDSKRSFSTLQVYVIYVLNHSFEKYCYKSDSYFFIKLDSSISFLKHRWSTKYR